MAKAGAQTQLADTAEVGQSGLEPVTQKVVMELDAAKLEKAMEELHDNAEELASVAAKKKAIKDAWEKAGGCPRALMIAFKQRTNPRSIKEREEANRYLECLGDLPLFAAVKSH